MLKLAFSFIQTAFEVAYPPNPPLDLFLSLSFPRFRPGSAFLDFCLQDNGTVFKNPVAGSEVGVLKSQRGCLGGFKVLRISPGSDRRLRGADFRVPRDHMAHAGLVELPKPLMDGENLVPLAGKRTDALDQRSRIRIDQPAGYTVFDTFLEAAEPGGDHRNIQLLHF